MAKLIFGLQQSLDGYVDHEVLGRPGPELFRHFAEHMGNLEHNASWTSNLSCLGYVYQITQYFLFVIREARDFPITDEPQPTFAAGKALGEFV